MLFGLRGSLAKEGSKENWDCLASAGLATRLIPGQSPVELRLWGKYCLSISRMWSLLFPAWRISLHFSVSFWGSFVCIVRPGAGVRCRRDVFTFPLVPFCYRIGLCPFILAKPQHPIMLSNYLWDLLKEIGSRVYLCIKFNLDPSLADNSSIGSNSALDQTRSSEHVTAGGSGESGPAAYMEHDATWPSLQSCCCGVCAK